MSPPCSPGTCCGCTSATPSGSHWATEVLDSTVTGLGGVKDGHAGGQGRKGAPGQGAWSRLKYEGGVHRVQRVPVTESQGRIHTSAAGVLVMPEAEQVEVDHRAERRADRRVPFLRARRPEREHHRLRGAADPHPDRHRGVLPEREEPAPEQGVRPCASCARGCWPQAQAEADAKASAERRSQVRTVDRSERVRTYNFPENRISDHRVGFKAYNLDQVIDGDLDAVIHVPGRRRDGRAARRATPPPAREAYRVRKPREPVRVSLLLDEIALADGPAGRGRGRIAPGGRRAEGGPRGCTGSSAVRTAHGASTAISTPGSGMGDRPPGEPGAAPAHHRVGVLPLPGSRGRPRGVRAPAGDRGHGRLGDRPAARRWTSPNR